ncbi:uncharacterized protein LOC126575853 [Anopheles aquasalis]|uniref:uncharacterized protein LOC126575853 n=1 Tax=Anopheles aquasalis TaxID=42839 RepID=UPI00215B681D|nr:uncharacterized protein LOC126575853 [Anopheles aquasalis]
MFLVVEIVNDNGEKEWKVAPKRWVCTSKNTQRPVLFWPDEFSAERQNQLAIEGTCKPLQSWMRRECVVKQEFPTYEAANTGLQALLSQHNNQIKEELEDPLNVEDPAFESSEPPCGIQSTPGDGVSMLVTIKAILESLIVKNARIEEQSTNILAQNSRIVNEISLLQKRVETMEQTVVQMAFNQFEPMDTIKQLRELDKKLSDESFNAELVQFLLANICSDETILRIKSCVDLLCTLGLQSKLQWVSLEKLQNFLNLLKKVGETPSERVTLSSLANFFEQNESSKKSSSSKRKIFLEPRGTAEELLELEDKLNDESFTAELLKWLLFKVRDNNAPWRIKSCLDLLCSLELQSKLSREDTVRRCNSSRAGSMFYESPEKFKAAVSYEFKSKAPF